jgi:hypothetical protein
MGHVERVCEVCQARKQRHTSFPEQAKYRARELLDLVHGNLCGPIAPATSGGNKYFLLLVDDLSRYMWVVAIPSKDYAMAAIKEIQARAEGESGCMLRALHIDRGGKFTFMEFVEYCMMEAVQSQHTAPHIPQEQHDGTPECQGGGYGEKHAQGERVAVDISYAQVDNSTCVQNIITAIGGAMLGGLPRV